MNPTIKKCILCFLFCFVLGLVISSKCCGEEVRTINITLGRSCAVLQGVRTECLCLEERSKWWSGGAT